jgi:hypothetical protein
MMIIFFMFSYSDRPPKVGCIFSMTKRGVLECIIHWVHGILVCDIGWFTRSTASVYLKAFGLSH